MKSTYKLSVMLMIPILLISLLSGITAPKASAATQFKDLKQGDFGFAEIIDLFERGVVSGFPGDEFQPNGILNRAQAAVMFQRALKLPIPADTTSFKDVKKDSYYAEAVAATLKAGIFKGSLDGAFGPNDQLTREQLASLLVRSMNLKPNTAVPVTINDLDQTHPAHQGDILTLYQSGVTKGKSGNLFDPKGQVTRAEFSVFVVRGVGESLPPKKTDVKKETEEDVENKELLEEKKDEEAKKEEQPPIAGGGGGGGGAVVVPSVPKVTSSYLETSSNERFNGSISNSNVTFTIPKGKLANLTDAKITVSNNATMTVRVVIAGIDINQERSQQLTKGENDLNIAQTISNNSGIIADLVGQITATGTLVDGSNSSNINLIFNITD